MKGQRVFGQFPRVERVASSITILLLLPAALAIGQNRAKRASGVQTGFITSSDLLQRPAASHYDVVALRVEFEPDSTSFSTGDGTFDGRLFEGVEGPRIDPLPHDEDYFEAHLQFLQNYVRRASDGKTTITTHLLPLIIRVSNRMGSYAPVGLESNSDEELRKLARLVEEAWTGASQLDSFDLPPGLDPDRTAFILFHAGVGRDIELVGTTLDKTPEDLPSLFFDTASLERLLGSFDVSLDGLSVTNTLIIPRTETRRGVNFIENEAFLVELSINGMLAASFMSYLGAPDLFDTNTGESAIGPFGIMDGLGIFAYGGLLPPEPSAWTKVFLAWSDIQFPSGAAEEVIRLEHSGSAISNDVFLAPIGEGEFFLVENRHRDPENDGLNLDVWRNGSIQNIHFDNGDKDFNSFSIRGFPGGVIVDADNLDFSLPGGLDESGTPLLGGALIWHIDEQRLSAGLPSNSVNVGADNRAVDLEEADGAQDVGFPNQSFFGPSFDAGSPFDFFYAGNPTTVITSTGSEIRLYENRFGPGTYPSSTSNAGGASFIEFAEFTAPAPTMEFKFRQVGVAGIEPRPDVAFTFDDSHGAFSDGGMLYYMGGDGVDFAAFGLNATGDGALYWSKDAATIGVLEPLLRATPAMSGTGIVALGSDAFWELAPDGNLRMSAALPSSLVVTRTTTPVVVMLDGRTLVGAEDASGPILLSAKFGQVQLDRVSSPILSIAVVDGLRQAFVYRGGAEIPALDLSWSFDAIQDGENVHAVFVRSTTGGSGSSTEVTGIVSDPAGERLILLQENGTVDYLDLRRYQEQGISGSVSAFAMLADLDDDGRPNALVAVGRTLLAFNKAGSILDGFPIQMRAETRLRPLIAEFEGNFEGDLEGDDMTVLFVAAVDGRIDAYDLAARNHSVPGFPLTVGSELAVSPVITDGSIVALSNAGSVTQWDIDRLGKIIWGSALGASNNAFLVVPRKPLVVCEASDCDGQETGLLTKGESYNWPNPIREGVTWIRFKPRERSDVEITIVDMAGRLIETLELSGAPGGMSSEIQWHPTVGSGIYLARIRATGASGRSDTHLIKLAIVR